jgi:outer membrane protein assembly factor BamB
LREQIGVLEYHRPGVWAPGGPVRAIELTRDEHWSPPERRPWNSRARLALAALVLAAATFIHISGITQPTGLRPTFVTAGPADAVGVDRGLAYVVRDRAVTAFRVSDGAVIWSRPVPGRDPNLFNLGDRRLLLSTMDTTQAVDAGSGRVVWSRPLRLAAVAGDVAVVGGERTADGVRLTGLSRETGETMWSATIPWTTMARQAPARDATVPVQREQAEVSLDGVLSIRDLSTGRIQARTAIPPRAMPTSISIAGRVVVVATGAGSIHAYDVRDLRPLWQRRAPVIGFFSQFAACGGHICHINDRGTVALDRDTGETRWQAPVRYHAQPLDDGHLLVSEMFHEYADSTGGVLDPASGRLIHELAPWTTLGVVDGADALVWRRDGQRRVIVGRFDTITGRTSVVGRTDPGFGRPTCAADGGFVLCAGDVDVVGWAT